MVIFHSNVSLPEDSDHVSTHQPPGQTGSPLPDCWVVGNSRNWSNSKLLASQRRAETPPPKKKKLKSSEIRFQNIKI